MDWRPRQQRGEAGLEWAKNQNDRRMLRLIEALEPERIVPEAAEHNNACGPGAVAATMAACLQYAADQAIVIEHTTSAETLRAVSAEPSADAVGYGGIVFARSSSDCADG